MDKEKIRFYFFIGLFTIASILTGLLFLPFLDVMILATIIAVVTRAPYEKLNKILGGRKNIAALGIVLGIVVLICIPLTLITAQIFQEASTVYTSVQNNESSLGAINDFIHEPLRQFIPGISLDLTQYADKALSVIVSNAGKVLAGTASIVGNLFLVLITLFFFLKDGLKFKKALIIFSPLKNVDDEEIALKLEQTINAVMKGTLFIAVIQGILVGLGLFIFGVPNATLWGTLAALASFIPGLGTGLVVVPAIAYLLLQGSMFSAIGLLLWGVFIVGFVDNLLLPYFYSKATPIHPIFVLFSILGGLALFGPLGFLFGPILVSLFFVLLDMYHRLVGSDKKVGNI